MGNRGQQCPECGEWYGYQPMSSGFECISIGCKNYSATHQKKHAEWRAKQPPEELPPVEETEKAADEDADTQPGFFWFSNPVVGGGTFSVDFRQSIPRPSRRILPGSMVVPDSEQTKGFARVLARSPNGVKEVFLHPDDFAALQREIEALEQPQETTETDQGHTASRAVSLRVGGPRSGKQESHARDVSHALWRGAERAAAATQSRPVSTEREDPHVVETPQSRSCSRCKSPLPKAQTSLGPEGYERMATYYATTSVVNFHTRMPWNPCCRRAMLREMEGMFPQYAQSLHTRDSADQPASRTGTPSAPPKTDLPQEYRDAFAKLATLPTLRTLVDTARCRSCGELSQPYVASDGRTCPCGDLAISGEQLQYLETTLAQIDALRQKIQTGLQLISSPFWFRVRPKFPKD